MLKNYIELWLEIKEQIELITDDKMIKYSNDFMKIKFKTSDDLPLSKIINIPVYAVIISIIFKENDKYHPQVLFHDVFINMKEILIL